MTSGHIAIGPNNFRSPNRNAYSSERHLSVRVRGAPGYVCGEPTGVEGRPRNSAEPRSVWKWRTSWPCRAVERRPALRSVSRWAETPAGLSPVIAASAVVDEGRSKQASRRARVGPSSRPSTSGGVAEACQSRAMPAAG